MDDEYVSADQECDLEIEECLDAQLDASQDLELLAQEIAEAAVEDEKRSSDSPSPTSPGTTHIPPLENECDEAQDQNMSESQASESEQQPRSSTPVDETSWVMVDTEEQDYAKPQEENDHSKSAEQRTSVFRMFLARVDLRQKLADLGLVCEGHPDDYSCQGEGLRLQDLVVSCSESMVICDLPQEGGEATDEAAPSQVFLKDPPDGPPMPGWRGVFSGATVLVSVERQGGLLVAGVRVWHVDLLSALSSLQHLVSSAGLVSYADVDVPSLLARAA